MLPKENFNTSLSKKIILLKKHFKFCKMIAIVLISVKIQQKKVGGNVINVNYINHLSNLAVFKLATSKVTL